jgi:LPXTG-site transpeptidase (sortase) family protein
MIPDPTSRPANRAPRGLARFIAGLALVAVTAACGSGDDVTEIGSTPTPAVTASPHVTEVSPEPTSATTSPKATKASRKRTPTQAGDNDGTYTLRIPRIGVHAPVVPIKSNEDRVLEPPRDPSIAGWWSDGAAPGEPRGSAVVVGHAVRNDGGGVFDDVGDLGRGDAIEVEGSDSTLNYRVKSVDVLSKHELARKAEEIFAQTGAGRLVVISCEDWDGTAWRSNVVTIAAPV